MYLPRWWWISLWSNLLISTSEGVATPPPSRLLLKRAPETRQRVDTERNPPADAVAKGLQNE